MRRSIWVSPRAMEIAGDKKVSIQILVQLEGRQAMGFTVS
jgi:hypothetical protein